MQPIEWWWWEDSRLCLRPERGSSIRRFKPRRLINKPLAFEALNIGICLRLISGLTGESFSQCCTGQLGFVGWAGAGVSKQTVLETKRQEPIRRVSLHLCPSCCSSPKQHEMQTVGLAVAQTTADTAGK